VPHCPPLSGTVEIITPADMEYVGVTSCPTLPVTSGNIATCIPQTTTKDVLVNGPNLPPYNSETSSGNLLACLNQPGYGVSYAFDTSTSYPYTPGVLSRWQGSLDFTIYKECGGGLAIGGAQTAALAGVALSQVGCPPPGRASYP
jgi:hypothetical protein